VKRSEYIACIEVEINARGIVMRINKVTKPLEKHRRRWEDIIKLDLKGTAFCEQNLPVACKVWDFLTS
jgi:hypothetical protein